MHGFVPRMPRNALLNPEFVIPGFTLRVPRNDVLENKKSPLQGASDC